MKRCSGDRTLCDRRCIVECGPVNRISNAFAAGAARIAQQWLSFLVASGAGSEACHIQVA